MRPTPIALCRGGERRAVDVDVSPFRAEMTRRSIDLVVSVHGGNNDRSTVQGTTKSTKSLVISARNGLTFDVNGSTFTATTQGYRGRRALGDPQLHRRRIDDPVVVGAKPLRRGRGTSAR